MVVKGVRSKVYQQVNLDDHDNSERKSRVLGRTENQYDRTLSLFDELENLLFLGMSPTYGIQLS